jgi:drug/metabolite transporter (DMT)-like permease
MEVIIASRRTTWLALGGMSLAMLIYGANFAISRHAMLNGLTSHDMLALRFATAGLLLLPVFLADDGWRNCAGVGWRKGLVLTVMSGFPMSYLMMQGLQYAPAAHGAAIGPGTVTVIGAIGSVVLFGAAVTGRLVIGIGAVLVGLACLAIAGTTSSLPNVLLGDLYFLGVGLVWGGYPLAVQLWKVDGLKGTAIVSVLSIVYLPIYYALFFNGFQGVSWWVVAGHAFNQGVLNVIVGLWIWGWTARTLGAAIVGRFPPLIPVIGTFLAILILGEWPVRLQWIGVALIVAGLLLASWRRAAASPDAIPDHQPPSRP